jgi:hypothetical protein
VPRFSARAMPWEPLGTVVQTTINLRQYSTVMLLSQLGIGTDTKNHCAKQGFSHLLQWFDKKPPEGGP